MRAALTAILIFALVTPAIAADAKAAAPADDRREAFYIMQNISYPEMDLVRRLGPVLLRGHQVGRVYYRAACAPDITHDVTFPRIRVRKPPDNVTGIEAMRAIFRDQNGVVATNDRHAIRIRTGDVPEDILKVRIARLSLSDYAQYNVIDALSAILRSPEVQAAEQKLGLTRPTTIVDHLVQPVMEEYPHLPPVLTDVTVDEALDKVATTFNLIVFYGINSCPTDAAFYVNYAMITPEMWRPEVGDIVDWLQIPRPFSVDNANACKEAGDGFNCEFDVLDINTDRPIRHVKVRAEWTDGGWKYSSLP